MWRMFLCVYFSLYYNNMLGADKKLALHMFIYVVHMFISVTLVHLYAAHVPVFCFTCSSVGGSVFCPGTHWYAKGLEFKPLISL